MKPIMIVAGTRPEIIKLLSVIRELRNLETYIVLVWSGQHYDYEMCRVFFKEFQLPKPDVNLAVGSGSHAEQTAKAMISLEKVMQDYTPQLVVAEGDTNTVVSTAITASKLKIPFAHIEAGVRSYDKCMPEEINRIVADRIAEIHLAPTELAKLNLLHEGTPRSGLYMTGSTLVDVVKEYEDIARSKGTEILKKLGLNVESYVLVTLHREENVENSPRLKRIVDALIAISEETSVIFPIHPRTRNKLTLLGLSDTIEEHLIVTAPLGYFDFLGILSHASVVLTDSGGIQQEAFLLGVPTVTLRYTTEWPETVLYGVNVLSGADTDFICEATLKQFEQRANIKRNLSGTDNPFGDGCAGKLIADIVCEKTEKGICLEFKDARRRPYITYRLVEVTENLKGLSEVEILASYNNDGFPSPDFPCARARWAVIRGPLEKLRKLEEGD